VAGVASQGGKWQKMAKLGCSRSVLEHTQPISNGNLGEAGIVGGGLFFLPYGYCNTSATQLN